MEQQVESGQKKLEQSQEAIHYLVVEVERIGHELEATNCSRLEAWNVSRYWKERLDNLSAEFDKVMANATSTLKLVKDLQARLWELEQKLSPELSESADEELQSSAELVELKNALNQLRVENADLKKLVLGMRYTQHPGNEADISKPVDGTSKLLKVKINELANENDEMKYLLRKLRYTPQPDPDMLNAGILQIVLLL